jgi:hypothetical protein
MKPAAAILTLVSSAGAALGSGCRVPPCGDVYNNKPWTIKLSDLSGGDDYCDAYNWHGGDDSPAPNMAHRPCKQNWISPGQHKGGWGNDYIDVDGFCFHDRSYRIRWVGAAGLSYTLNPGV